MSKVARSIQDLIKILQNNIDNAMKNDVANTGLDVLNKHVTTDVYDAYKSKAKNPYERTYKLYEDMDAEWLGNGTVKIRSTREEDGKDIAAIVETGKGYTWVDSEIYHTEQARPFHKNAAEELRRGAAKESLIKGLKKQGLNVK